MVCKKCGYKDEKESSLFGSTLCRVCAAFAPTNISLFQNYTRETMDWKAVDMYRKYNHYPGARGKQEMKRKASEGKVLHRAPLGYSLIKGALVQNEDASKVHSLFTTFLSETCSLNALAKRFDLSVNGVKKILTNRTYLGEVKFGGIIYKGLHEPLIAQEVFYAVQRKLKERIKKV